MSFEKEKRKNEDAPSMFWRLLQGLWHYGVALPLQGTWWLTYQSVSYAWWLTKNGLQLGWATSKWAVQAPRASVHMVVVSHDGPAAGI